MVGLLLFICLALFIMVADPVEDFRQISQNKYIRYARENGLAFAAYGIAAAIGLLLGSDWRLIAASAVLIPGVRWIVHDAILNRLRGKKLDYLGKRSKADRFLSHIRPVTHPITVKLFALNILCLISILILTL